MNANSKKPIGALVFAYLCSTLGSAISEIFPPDCVLMKIVDKFVSRFYKYVINTTLLLMATREQC